MYLEDCKARFQKNTWRQKAFVFRNFLALINDDPEAESITKQTFIEYLKSRKTQKDKMDRKAKKAENGACVANRDLKEFKALFNWCIRQELLLKNPCINIESYPEQTTARYVPPAEDITKVLLAADREDMDLILTLYHTAGRATEIMKLIWDDVNFEHRWIRLWTRKRRGGELQEDKLAMTDTLYDVLKRRWDIRDKATPYVFHNADGTRYTYTQKKDTMKKLCRKAGVKVFGFHAIRHHVASILADSGKASLSQIQKMLRHRRTTTTDNYIKTLDPQLRQVANVLDEQGKMGKKSESSTIGSTI
jgi:integrase